MAFESVRAGHLTKAHKSNAIYTESHVRVKDLPADQRQILYDPQTSGGLLLCVNSEEAETILNKLKSRFPASSLIGDVGPSSPDFFIEVV
jgi:selenide,water dikinase